MKKINIAELKVKEEKDVKLWLARNFFEELILYKEQPSYNNKIKMWVGGGLLIGKLKGYYFPEVTLENSPQQVELKLVK